MNGEQEPAEAGKKKGLSLGDKLALIAIFGLGEFVALFGFGGLCAWGCEPPLLRIAYACILTPIIPIVLLTISIFRGRGGSQTE